MLESEYDEFAKTYDGNYSTPEYRREDEQLMALIARFAIVRTLDVGCGTGLYLDYRQVDPAEYLGIDPSQGMLDNGWKDEDICKELGMEPEELIRLKHITGFSKLFADTEYKKSWETRKQILLKKEHKDEVPKG